MSRKIETKDVITVTAIAGLGYLLLIHKSQGPTGGGGGGSKKEGVTGVIADELGGLGITTPNYTINIPGAGGQSIVFPDFPEPPPMPDTIDKPDKKLFDWPKVNLPVINLGLENIIPEKGMDLLTQLFIETPLQIIQPHKAFTKPKIDKLLGQGLIQAPLSIMQMVGLFKEPTEKLQGTGTVRSKKGRSTRVKDFREKYKIPESYNYPVTSKAIKVL
jgi:hypothetical protein